MFNFLDKLLRPILAKAPENKPPELEDAASEMLKTTNEPVQTVEAIKDELIESGPVNPLANAWGSGIAWVAPNDGFRLAHVDSKPLMRILHKNKCPFSRHLRRKVCACRELALLSSFFVCVNEDLEGSQRADAEDRRNFPQIRFYHADGTPMREVISQKGTSWPYAYSELDGVVFSMLAALRGHEWRQLWARVALTEF